MRVILVVLFFVTCSTAKKTLSENDDDEEGTAVIPETSFTCDGKIDGFYADIETNCSFYHYCQTFVYPDDDIETKDWPFQCPPTTIFRQQHLTCSKPHKNFKCEDSEKFYDVNDKPADKPPASKPVLPEQKPTTTPSPTTSLETEPPTTAEPLTTTETPEEATTIIPEKVETPQKPKPDDGFLLPPLKPGEHEDQFFLLPHPFPYLFYPTVLPSWFHYHVKNHFLKPFSVSDFKKLAPKEPAQTLDDYLEKTSWENVEKHLKKGILPASTKLLDAKLPEIVVPKFDKKLFETSYTIKNGKLTDEPFKFKFFTDINAPTGPR